MPLLDWIQSHELLLAWLGGLGLLIFLGSLVAIPLIIAVMPADYFVQPKSGAAHRRPIRQLGHVLKNLLGAVLLLAGIAMLLLPGQGLLTMAIGLSLLDFPGKRQLQVRALGMRRVQRPIVWIRHKAGRPPLLIPNQPAGRTGTTGTGSTTDAP